MYGARKCGGMGGVLETGNVKHVACMKHRKCTGNLTFNIQEIVPCTIIPYMQGMCMKFANFRTSKYTAKISPLLYISVIKPIP